MNPFTDSQTKLSTSLWSRLAAQAGLIALVICLVLGSTVVVWRAWVRRDAAKVVAHSEASVRAAAVEAQLNQALTAAEVLGALARQSGGAVPNFQKVAQELLATRPGLASLELQPGGVVSEVVPRAGHERTIGLNVLNDPAHRFGAALAIQRGVLTVAGPVPLDQGEPGIVARVPILQRGTDGHDRFWGFVAVSMRFAEALARARVDEVSSKGYDYIFFLPASVRQKAVRIAVHGRSAFEDSVQQPVRVQSLEFHLALQPRGGWVNIWKVALESLGALFVSGFVLLLVNLLASRPELEAALAAANRELARETADRKQAQQDCLEAKGGAVAAQAELKQTRLALQQAESLVAESQARLEPPVSSAQDTREDALGELKQAQQTIHQMQAQIEAAVRAKSETAAAAQTRLQQNQAAMADLHTRLDIATRSAQKADEASAAKLHQLEESNRELKARLRATEKVDARVAELTTLLEQATEDLQRQREASAKSSVSPAPEQIVTAPTKAEEPNSEALVRQKPEPAAPRKKSRRQNQMDLFAEQHPTDRPKSESRPEALHNEAPVEPSPLKTVEPAPPSLAAVTAEPKQSAGETKEQVPPPPKDSKPAPARPLPPSPPVNPAELRKAVNLILPLLTDQDPGAKDCLKDNRTPFRSAFTPEGYAEFEQLVKGGDLSAALEHLKIAARKHGIPV